MEEFRSIDGFDAYEVGDLGTIRRVRGGPGAQLGKILRQYHDRKGYLRVELWKNGRPKTWIVSRLVCRAFHGYPPSEIHHAAHKNGCRDDNRSSNLYWATPSENQRDRIGHGTHCRGERSNLAKISDSDARIIVIACRNAKKGEKVAMMAELAKKHGVTDRAIQAIVYGTVRKSLFEERA